MCVMFLVTKSWGVYMRRATLLGLIASSFLAGCAGIGPRAESRITEFHELTPPTPTDTYTILPMRKEQGESLEFKTFANQLANGLRAKGYNVVTPNSPAKYAVFFDYGVDEGRTVVSNYSIPQYGVTGYRNTSTTGTISSIGNTAYVNAQTYSTPTYGITGYQQGTSTSQVFKRFLNLDIVEVPPVQGAPLKKVYEGRLVSEGSCGTMPAVLPTLLTSMLEGFPGESGKTRKEVRPVPKGGC